MADFSLFFSQSYLHTDLWATLMATIKLGGSNIYSLFLQRPWSGRVAQYFSLDRNENKAMRVRSLTTTWQLLS